MSHSLERDLKLVSLGSFRRRLVELFSFDAEYVRRLRAGDAAVEAHFNNYFRTLILLMLRNRGIRQPLADDILQDTFERVLRKVFAPAGGLDRPEALGKFVTRTCNNIVMESYRAGARYQPLADDYAEHPSTDSGAMDALLTKENQTAVREVLDSMPPKDASLLRAAFIDERPKDDICAQFGVDRDYLRVLLHRAKQQFSRRYIERFGAAIHPGRGEA